jgi:hypothetical protein
MYLRNSASRDALACVFQFSDVKFGFTISLLVEEGFRNLRPEKIIAGWATEKINYVISVGRLQEEIVRSDDLRTCS